MLFCTVVVCKTKPRIRPNCSSVKRSRIISTSWRMNVFLFVATFVSMTLVGSSIVDKDAPSFLLMVLNGWVFSVPLILILLAHEMGHYLAGRRHRLDVTPPFFIPGPPLFPLPGTFGAFIKIRSPISDRRVLMEVGAWGPIAGSIVGIPLLALGISLSEIRPAMAEPKGLIFGSSLILELLCLARLGEFSSNAVIVLHPTALAAWFGLFVTAMNLLPIGQLDGGHVIYSLFGPKIARPISFALFVCLVPLGVMLWTGWLVLSLILVFLGLRHPPTVDQSATLTPGVKLLGLLAIVLFVLTFVPVPLSFVE